MSNAANPYAAPTARVEDVSANAEAEAIRQAHISHEASVKSVGILQLFAGWGVRGLRRWGRILGCILSALGLLGFPIGTLINAYILYLFLSKKGRTIFAPEYQDVIAATPDVKYRTSIVVWIVLGLLVILVAAAFVLPQLASRR